MSDAVEESPRLRRRDLRTVEHRATTAANGAATPQATSAPRTTSASPSGPEPRSIPSTRSTATTRSTPTRRQLRLTGRRAADATDPVEQPAAASPSDATARPQEPAHDAASRDDASTVAPAVHAQSPTATRVRRRDLRAQAEKAQVEAVRVDEARHDEARVDEAGVDDVQPDHAPVVKVPVPASERFPSRRELRTAQRSVAPWAVATEHAADAAGTRHRRRVVRTSLVAAVAAVGTLGVVVPVSHQYAPVADAHVLPAQVSALTAPTFSVLNDPETPSTTVADELLASGGADARATYAAASRSETRDDLRCSPELAASGTRAALTETSSTVMPMAADSYRVSSRFGWRVHPISGTSTFHTGDDFAAPYGTPIHAVADGVVTHAGPGIEGRSGTLVVIEHEVDGQTFETWSTHMSPSGVHVEVGDTVTAGQHFADVGSWGNSTGPHLHLEVHVGGETVAPIEFLESVGAVDPSQAC